MQSFLSELADSIADLGWEKGGNCFALEAFPKNIIEGVLMTEIKQDGDGSQELARLRLLVTVRSGNKEKSQQECREIWRRWVNLFGSFGAYRIQNVVSVSGPFFNPSNLFVHGRKIYSYQFNILFFFEQRPNA